MSFFRNFSESGLQARDKILIICSVITDAKEWAFHRAVNGITQTRVETDMFMQEKETEAMKMSPSWKVLLKPSETIHIPFKYTSLTTTPDELCESKSLRATFTQNNDDLLGILILHIHSQPIVINQSFRYYNQHNSVFTKLIQPDMTSSYTTVLCSDPTVLCHVKKYQDNRPMVYLRCGTHKSPGLRSFNVYLYNDEYMAKCIYCIRVNLHSVQTVLINGLQGSVQRQTVCLKGDTTQRYVKIYASNSSLTIEGEERFNLGANTIRDLQLKYTPLEHGEDTLLVNCVDCEQRSIIDSWMIIAKVAPAVPNKTFQVTAPKDAEKPLNKVFD
jgi:hypothetical protein